MFAHCRTASASGTVSPSSARACAVSISRSGWTTTAVSPAGTGSRMMSGGFGRRTSTKPPQMHGAMLSACADPAPSRSPSSAQAISVSIDDCAPISASTATTAAAALAALPPSPLDSGSPLRMLQRHPAPFAELRQQRQRGHARRVARGLARQPAAVAVDVLDADARARRQAEPRRHLVARARRARSRARRSRTRRSTRSPAQTRSRKSSRVMAADRRNEVLAERALEVVGRVGSPSRRAPPSRPRRPATNPRSPAVSRQSYT